MQEHPDEIQLLPRRLRKLSLSDREVVLPRLETFEAIELFAEMGLAVPSWEGWLSYGPESAHPGSRGHSRYQGTVSLVPRQNESWTDFVTRCGEYMRETITADAASSDASPEKPGTTLHFCLEVASEADYAAGYGSQTFAHTETTTSTWRVSPLPSTEQLGDLLSDAVEAAAAGVDETTADSLRRFAVQSGAVGVVVSFTETRVMSSPALCQTTLDQEHDALAIFASEVSGSQAVVEHFLKRLRAGRTVTPYE